VGPVAAPFPDSAGRDLAVENDRRNNCGQAVHRRSEQRAEGVADGQDNPTLAAVMLAIECCRQAGCVDLAGKVCISLGRSLQLLITLRALATRLQPHHDGVILQLICSGEQPIAFLLGLLLRRRGLMSLPAFKRHLEQLKQSCILPCFWVCLGRRHLRSFSRAQDKPTTQDRVQECAVALPR
jgi:hypothetical protein